MGSILREIWSRSWHQCVLTLFRTKFSGGSCASVRKIHTHNRNEKRTGAERSQQIVPICLDRYVMSFRKIILFTALFDTWNSLKESLILRNSHENFMKIWKKILLNVFIFPTGWRHRWEKEKMRQWNRETEQNKMSHKKLFDFTGVTRPWEESGIPVLCITDTHTHRRIDDCQQR